MKLYFSTFSKHYCIKMPGFFHLLKRKSFYVLMQFVCNNERNTAVPGRQQRARICTISCGVMPTVLSYPPESGATVTATQFLHLPSTLLPHVLLAAVSVSATFMIFRIMCNCQIFWGKIQIIC